MKIFILLLEIKRRKVLKYIFFRNYLYYMWYMLYFGISLFPFGLSEIKICVSQQQQYNTVIRLVLPISSSFTSEFQNKSGLNSIKVLASVMAALARRLRSLNIALSELTDGRLIFQCPHAFGRDAFSWNNLNSVLRLLDFRIYKARPFSYLIDPNGFLNNGGL